MESPRIPPKLTGALKIFVFVFSGRVGILRSGTYLFNNLGPESKFQTEADILVPILPKNNTMNFTKYPPPWAGEVRPRSWIFSSVHGIIVWQNGYQNVRLGLEFPIPVPDY